MDTYLDTVNRPVTVEEDHLSVILTEDLETDDFTVETSLELHPEVVEVVTPDPGLVDPRGQNILAVSGDFQTVTDCRHLEILNELNPLPDLEVGLHQLPPLPLSQPVRQRLARREVVDLHIVGCRHLHAGGLELSHL